jgi:hypothetical protein
LLGSSLAAGGRKRRIHRTAIKVLFLLQGLDLYRSVDFLQLDISKIRNNLKA